MCVCVCRPFGLKFLSQIDVYIANLGSMIQLLGSETSSSLLKSDTLSV